MTGAPEATCLLAEMIVGQHLKGVRLSAAPLAESELTQRLLVQIIRRIERLAGPAVITSSTEGRAIRHLGASTPIIRRSAVNESKLVALAR